MAMTTPLWLACGTFLVLLALVGEVILIRVSSEAIRHRNNFWIVVGLRWLGIKAVALAFLLWLRTLDSWLFFVFTWALFAPGVLLAGIGMMGVRRILDVRTPRGRRSP